MNSVKQNEIVFAKTFDGFDIVMMRGGDWKVMEKNGCFDLNDSSDFWRVVALLERPFDEVVDMFAPSMKLRGMGGGFPFGKVVNAGLGFGLDHWAALSLRWFPELRPEEQILSAESLATLENAAWASAESKALAQRFSRQIYSVCH